MSKTIPPSFMKILLVYLIFSSFSLIEELFLLFDFHFLGSFAISIYASFFRFVYQFYF